MEAKLYLHFNPRQHGAESVQKYTDRFLPDCIESHRHTVI